MLIVSKLYLLLILRLVLLLLLLLLLELLLLVLVLQLLQGKAWEQGSLTPSLTTTTTTPWVYLQQRETNIISNLSCHLSLPPDTNLSDIPPILVIWCCKTSLLTGCKCTHEGILTVVVLKGKGEVLTALQDTEAKTSKLLFNHK